MTTAAWPFVASRNQALDWRPLLAPPFLIDARADFLLVTSTAGDGPHPVPPTLRHLSDGRVGDLSVVFRSRPAEPHLAGIEGDGQLRDRFGRLVWVVEGLALRGRVNIELEAIGRALDSVHGETLALYPAFWSSTDEAAAPRRSEEIVVAQESPGHRNAPPFWSGRPGRISPTQAAGGAAATFGLLILLGRHRRRSRGVRSSAS